MPLIRNACPSDPSHDHRPVPFHNTHGLLYTCPTDLTQWTYCVIDQTWHRHSRWFNGQLVTLIGTNVPIYVCEAHSGTYYCERCSQHGWEEGDTPDGYENSVIICSDIEDNNGNYYEYLCRTCLTAISGATSSSPYNGGTCTSCSNPREHFDLIKEQYVCSCQVQALVASNPAYPIKMAKARDLASVMP